MSKINDLTILKESKEYKEILEKNKNRQDAIETVIMQHFPNVDNTQCVSIHDMNYQKMMFLIEMVEELQKLDYKGVSYMIEDIDKDIEGIRKFCTRGMKDQYGIANSSPLYNSLDLKRGQVQDYMWFDGLIDYMIDAEKEDEEENKEEVYD